MKSGLSRRHFLKGLGAGLGAAVGTRLAGPGLFGEAKAAITEPTTVVLVHLFGGYNAIFASADSLVGHFGVAAGNYSVLGNGLAVDNVIANGFSAFAKSHMAAVGVKHGTAKHPDARRILWSHNGSNAGLVLANAMGGTASIKAAAIGGGFAAEASTAAVNGVSYQGITDIQKTIEALGGSTVVDPRKPDRAIALSGVEAARSMSANSLASSPGTLESVRAGYDVSVDTLKQPVRTFDIAQLRAQYGLGNATAVTNIASKLAAAELMVRAGTNVVTIFDTSGGGGIRNNWDDHGDRDATAARTRMTRIIRPLSTFVDRVVADPACNVTLVIMGDFARSLPNSDHATCLTATVIGKNVKQGTTGRTAPGTVTLAANTPTVPGFWSYLAALSKLDGSPFGPNQHPALLR